MKFKLDRIDIKILQALQNDARLSNKSLAAHVALAASTCLERVRRLQRLGVLRGFHAEVNPGSMGVGLQAMMAIRLREHHTELARGFVHRVMGLEEVVAAYSVAGEVDFQLHVAVRDTAHLQTLAGSLHGMGEIAQIKTSLIFEYHRSRGWPDYTEVDL